MKINIFNNEDYFIKRNSKWYLVAGEEEKEVTKEDCDIDILDCGSDGDTVYSSAIFG